METYRIVGPLSMRMHEAPGQSFVQAKLVGMTLLVIWLGFLIFWGVAPKTLILGAIILAAAKLIPHWIGGETHETFAFTNRGDEIPADFKILLGALVLAMRSAIALLLLFATIQIGYGLVITGAT